MKILSLFSIVVLTSSLAGTALGGVADMEENFSFSGLLSDNGWTAHSGGGTQAIDTVAGLTYTGYASSGYGNAANLDNNGEDVNRLIGPYTTAGSQIYVSLLMKVTGTTPEGYFLHLGTSTVNSSFFRGKIFVTSDGTGDYELGLSYAANTPVAKTALDLSFNTTYLVVLRYNIVSGTENDTADLHVFSSGVPAIEPIPLISLPDEGTAADPANLGALVLRQYNASQKIVVDGIRVDTTWADAPLPVSVSSFSIE